MIKDLLLAMLIACFLTGFAPLKELTLEEKVGQLLMVHFYGKEVNEDAKILIQTTHVGGIIYYNWCNGLSSPQQVAALSAGLQKMAAIPLFIAVDQEGGSVARLTDGFTSFPSNREVALTGNPQMAEAVALAMGREMRAVGVNMNLAPVIDVTSERQGSVISSRSFGGDPEIVAAFGGAALRGYQQAHVLATLKHFPGYGDVTVDPHEDLPMVRKSLQLMERTDLLPFAKLAPSADAIMTAHLFVPALDREKCSTLSKLTLDYLKEKIGFQGIIVSDSLAMEGVLKQCKTVDEAAIQAFIAGCDILILGGKQLSGEYAGFELTVVDVQRIHRSLVEAVKSGRISQARLSESLTKISNCKKRLL